MEHQSSTSDVHRTDQDLADERRAAVRFPCKLDTTCEPQVGTTDKSWPARAINISANGIAIVLERRFARGAILSIRLDSFDGRTTRNLLLKVVYAKAQDDGLWRLGCVFASELSDEELQAFQAKRLRPAEPDFRAWVRFPCNVDTVCRELWQGHDERFAVRVLDISPSGMSLLTPRRSVRGTLLNVELPSDVGAIPQHVLVRVVSDRRFSSNQWILGCEMADQLNEQELQSFT